MKGAGAPTVSAAGRVTAVTGVWVSDGADAAVVTVTLTAGGRQAFVCIRAIFEGVDAPAVSAEERVTAAVREDLRETSVLPVLVLTGR